jgi:hypothetical protein
MNGQVSWLSFASFAVAGRGKQFSGPFKSLLLAAADAPHEASFLGPPLLEASWDVNRIPLKLRSPRDRI